MSVVFCFQVFYVLFCFSVLYASVLFVLFVLNALFYFMRFVYCLIFLGCMHPMFLKIRSFLYSKHKKRLFLLSKRLGSQGVAFAPSEGVYSRPYYGISGLFGDLVNKRKRWFSFPFALNSVPCRFYFCISMKNLIVMNNFVSQKTIKLFRRHNNAHAHIQNWIHSSLDQYKIWYANLCKHNRS